MDGALCLLAPPVVRHMWRPLVENGAPRPGHGLMGRRAADHLAYVGEPTPTAVHVPATLMGPWRG